MLSFKLKGAVVEACEVYSDAMNTDLIEAMSGIFVGKRFETQEIQSAMEAINVTEELKPAVKEISQWIQTLAI